MSAYFDFGEQENAGILLFATKEEVSEEDLDTVGLPDSLKKVMRKVSTNFGQAETEELLKEVSA